MHRASTPLWFVFFILALTLEARAEVDPRRWGAAGSPITEAVGAEYYGPVAADGNGGLHVFSKGGVLSLFDTKEDVTCRS